MNKQTQFIIVEGLDGCGKSTFIKKLKKDLEKDNKKVGLFHNTSKHKRTIFWYKNKMLKQSKKFDYMIWDRAFIGPFIWPFFFMGQKFKIKNPYKLKNMLKQFDIKIIYNVIKNNDLKIIKKRRPKEYKPKFVYVQKLFEAIINLLFEKQKIIKHDGVFDLPSKKYEKILKEIKIEKQ